jgi:hypothetical protein
MVLKYLGYVNFRVQGLGFRVKGLGYRAQGLGLSVWDVGLRVWGCCLAHGLQWRRVQSPRRLQRLSATSAPSFQSL